MATTRENLKRIKRGLKNKALDSTAGQLVASTANSRVVKEANYTVKHLNSKKGAFNYLAFTTIINGVYIGVTNSFNSDFALGIVGVTFLAYIFRGDKWWDFLIG